MRAAAAADWWRRVYSRSYPIRVEKVEFSGVVGLGSGTIQFSGGLSALCGPNGVGKSTLLYAIRGALSEESPAVGWGHVKNRFGVAELVAHLSQDGQPRTIRTTFGPFAKQSEHGIEPFSVEWMSPAAESGDALAFLDGVENFGELLEAHSPRRLSAKENELRCVVVGRDYEYCEVYELEDVDGRERVFPYFRVRAAGVNYGSESMGRGELALHIALWRLEGLDRRSVLLLEEPETHLPPRSQLALMDVVAKTSVEREVWTVLTTHSSHVLANVPEAHIRMLCRSETGIAVLPGPSAHQVAGMFGTPGQKAALLAVEDQAALEIVMAVLGARAPDLLSACDVHVVGAVPQIDALVRNYPRTASYRVVGVYDGDQRAKADEHPSPCVFLPSDGPPESLLRGGSIAPQSLADRLGRDSATVQATFAGIEGLNHHDWLIQLGMGLGLHQSQLVAGLVAVWMGTAEGERLTAELIKDLRAALLGGS